MGTVAPTNPGGDYRPAPEGNHLAVCVQVLDMGHQWKLFDGGMWKHEVRLVFELTGELMDDGRPFTVGRSFPLTMNEKSNLYKFMKGWGIKASDLSSGRYDVAERLGKPCMLTVSHADDAQGRTWANVEAAAPLPKGFPPPTPVNDLIYYSTDNGPPGPEVPERIAERIRKCQEFGGQPEDGRTQVATAAPRRGTGPGPVTPMGTGTATHAAHAPSGNTGVVTAEIDLNDVPF